MGRETKLLLGLLATLAGVFVGVLSMKLLVPRPPAGAGPDVAVDGASVEPHELVEPPNFSGRRVASNAQISADAFASAPAHARPATAGALPEAADAPAPLPLAAVPRHEAAAESPLEPPPAAISAFAPREIVADDVELAPPDVAPEPRAAPSAAVPSPPQRDPFVTAASHDVAVVEPPRPALPATAAPSVDSAFNPAVAAAASAPTYVAAAGDSWWNLAERAYGDGRLYRALYAWNRVINPRVSLAPGTPLEIPPKPRLEAAWPALMPAPAVR
jgi:5'-nucleotidase/UDP-sugar diphosphatase